MSKLSNDQLQSKVDVIFKMPNIKNLQEDSHSLIRTIKSSSLRDISNNIVTTLDIIIFKRQLHYTIFILNHRTQHAVEQVNLNCRDNNIRFQRSLSESILVHKGIYVRALYAHYRHHMGAINHIIDFFRDLVSITNAITDSSTDSTSETNGDSLDDSNS